MPKPIEALLPDSDDGDIREFSVGSLKVVIAPEEDVTWCPVYVWTVFKREDEDDVITLFAPTADCAEFCARMFCYLATPPIPLSVN